MPAERVYRVTNPDDLECALTLFSAADGGVSAGESCENPFRRTRRGAQGQQRDVGIIMLTVTDDRGTVLSVPARKLGPLEKSPTFAMDKNSARVGAAVARAARVSAGGARHRGAWPERKAAS